MNLDSTIKELYLYESQIEISHLGKEIVKKFKENPELPGIIITENNRFITSFSQRRFWEKMSRPYSLELFLKRPIRSLYNSNFAESNSLILAADISIPEAVSSFLQRSKKLIDEPIVVEIEPQVYRLLDPHQLLVAHGQIYELLSKVLVQVYDRLESVTQQKINSVVGSHKEEINFSSSALSISTKPNSTTTIENLLQFANRYQFEEYLQQQWEQGIQEQIWISLVICYANFYRDLSDVYNFEAEIKCLRQIKAIIKQSVERLQGFTMSYGENQFAVILSNTEASEITYTLEKIRQKIPAFKIGKNDLQINSYCTLSFGVARMIPSSVNSPQILIAAAEQALEHAQKHGQTYKMIWH